METPLPELEYPTPFLERLEPMPAPVRNRFGRPAAVAPAAFDVVLLAAFTAFALLRGAGTSLVASSFAWIALVSFEAAIVSLLPMQRGSMPSDGARARDALAQNARWQREAAFGKLLRARLNGAGFDDGGETALDDALRLNDVSRRAFGANSMAWTTRSPRNRQQALRYVEAMIRCSGYATPHERAHLQAQCVILTGWYAKRPALAKAWAVAIDRKFATPSDRLRVAAVLAALDGDYLGAVRNVQELLDDAVTDAAERDEVYEKNMGLWIAQLRAMAERDGAPARIAVAAG